MPVLIVGADSPFGSAIVDALASRNGEVRAFVSTAEVLDRLRTRGIKTALGDVSDGSHVGGAALNAFAAVLIAQAATDARERSFATTPEAVYDQWADGLKDAAVTRVIWVGETPIPEAIADVVQESASVSVQARDVHDVAAEVARLDEAAVLGSE